MAKEKKRLGNLEKLRNLGRQTSRPDQYMFLQEVAEATEEGKEEIGKRRKAENALMRPIGDPNALDREVNWSIKLHEGTSDSAGQSSWSTEYTEAGSAKAEYTEQGGKDEIGKLGKLRNLGSQTGRPDQYMFLQEVAEVTEGGKEEIGKRRKAENALMRPIGDPNALGREVNWSIKLYEGTSDSAGQSSWSTEYTEAGSAETETTEPGKDEMGKLGNLETPGAKPAALINTCFYRRSQRQQREEKKKSGNVGKRKTP